MYAFLCQSPSLGGIILKKILIVCPVCSKSRRIAIPHNIFDVDEGYLLKFPIRKNLICSHEFLVVTDYNFSIRDYEIPSETNDLTHYFEEKQKPLDVADFAYF